MLLILQIQELSLVVTGYWILRLLEPSTIQTVAVRQKETKRDTPEPYLWYQERTKIGQWYSELFSAIHIKGLPLVNHFCQSGLTSNFTMENKYPKQNSGNTSDSNHYKDDFFFCPRYNVSTSALLGANTSGLPIVSFSVPCMFWPIGKSLSSFLL